MIKELTGAQVVIEFLERNGFKHVFGLPGRRILPLYDAAYGTSLRMIATQHEQGGSYMAECYSQLNGKGACVGISGPGAMNLLNGVAAAYADSIPILVLGGQAKREDFGRYAIQESTGRGRTPNQMALFRAVSKFSALVEGIELLPQLLRDAYVAMNSGRKGPSYLEIPTNVLHETLSLDPESLRIPEIDIGALNAADAGSVRAAAELIAQAKKPLLLLGNGAVLSRAETLAQQIVAETGMPYASTLLAKGLLPEDQPLSLGCVGIWGQPAANEYLLSQVDTLIAVGTTFQELSTLGWRTLAGKKVVRIDIDAQEINRNCTPAVAIVADAASALEQLLEQLRLLSVRMPSDLVGELDALKARYGYYETFKLDKYERIANGMLKTYDVLIELGKLRGKDDILVLDVGENSYFSEFLIKSYSRRTYLTNAGLGSMGFSVAGAIGAKFAEPSRNVISITGDGGFLMNCNELATASHHKQKVVWCVLNNGILGTQKHYQRDFCAGRYIACDVPAVDMVGLANSLGVKAQSVHTIEEFRSAFSDALHADEASVLNIIVDPAVKPIPPFAF